MPDLRQYDPLQVVASWTTPGPYGTVDIVDGRVDDQEFLNSGRDKKRWELEGDGNANATRVKQNRKTGTISITLSASSPTNETLSKIAALDDASENQVGALVIRDLNGQTIVTCTGAFLEDVPDPTFGATRGERVWTWRCATIVPFVGGHDLA